jgi:hypothetical protein
MASSAPVTTLDPCLSNSRQNTGNPCPRNVAWWLKCAAAVRSGNLQLLPLLLLALWSPVSRRSSCCGRVGDFEGRCHQLGTRPCAGSCCRDGRAARGPSASKVLRPCTAQHSTGHTCRAQTQATAVRSKHTNAPPKNDLAESSPHDAADNSTMWLHKAHARTALGA